MTQREPLIKNIANAFAYIKSEVETLGWLGLYDAHVFYEHIFKDVLNITYGYSLKHTNELGPNHPGIDLGDVGKKTAYQVTSESTKRKVQHTIDKFAKHEQYKHFDHLFVLILGKAQDSYPNLDIPQEFTFDETKNIVDLRTLANEGKTLDLPTLQSLADYIASELPAFGPGVQLDKQTDSDALKIYRNYFDRSALQDNWADERNVGNFGIAIDDLLSLLQKGFIRGEAIAKPRTKFKDGDLRKDLDATFQSLRLLGGLYARHVRTEEIDLDKNRYKFHDSATETLFNTSKQNVINAINVALARIGLPEIQGVSGI